MIVRITFLTGDTYLDVIGFTGVNHLLADCSHKGNLFLTKKMLSNPNMIPVAENIVIPFTSIKMYYEIKEV